MYPIDQSKYVVPFPSSVLVNCVALFGLLRVELCVICRWLVSNLHIPEVT